MTKTTLERRSGISLWRQIAQHLHEEIKSGELQPGSKLPTEPHLARRFGVNRHTVRRALSVLQEEGLVSIEQGRGTFVRTPNADYHPGEDAHLSGNIGREGREAGGELITSRHLAAEPKVAAALGLRPGEDVILLELLHLVDHRPVSIASHYFPAHRFKGLEKRFLKSHSITQALKSYGIADYMRKRTKVNASLPNSEDARVLKMPRGQPVVVAENVNVDLDGKPIEFTISRSAGGRMQLMFER